MPRRRVQGALQGRAVVGLPVKEVHNIHSKEHAAKRGMNSHVVDGCSVVEWSMPGACCLVRFREADVHYFRFVSLLSKAAVDSRNREGSRAAYVALGQLMSHEQQ